MKNKHLVLLFLGVLAGGLLARRLPFWRDKQVDTLLIEADTARVSRLVLTVPGQAEMTLERMESGWLVSQNQRTAPAPPAEVNALLSALTGIHCLRIVKTRRPDTLGLATAASLGVQIFVDGKRSDQFQLGRETSEGGEPATYLGLPGHEGTYLVRGHLRGIFAHSLTDFRAKKAVSFDPAAITTVLLREKNQPERSWQKDDSLGTWLNADTLLNRPDAAVQAWLRLLLHLNGQPFADGFDDSLADENLLAEIVLQQAGSSAVPAVHLRIFRVVPPELPDDPTRFRHDKNALASWVLHSAQNPDNFFALPDSALARQVCFGLLPPPDPAATPAETTGQ